MALRRAERCPTAALHGVDDVLAAAGRTGLAPETADVQVWAVAGLVSEEGQAAATNASLRLDLRALAARGARVLLINDFAAQAWASLALPGEESLSVLPGEAACGPRGVVGAGTGLGTACLFPEASGRWRVLCAEAGHTAFPFLGREEVEYADFLCARHGGAAYATAEQVLSGRGLELLHLFLVGETAPVEHIAATRLREAGTSERPGHPTLRWFARFYGRMCRHWVLSTLCTGGLYVGGGVAGRNPALVLAPDFTREFRDVPAHLRPLLRHMPVRLMTGDLTGLWGAAKAGQEFLLTDSR